MKKNTSSFILFILLLLILFVPQVKAFILEKLMYTGLYNTEIKANEKQHKLTIPDWSLKIKRTNGKTYTLNDFKGKVIIINFWATWCAPCLAELPNLNALYISFKDEKELIFLTVEADGDIAKATKIFKNRSLSLPLYLLNSNYETNLFKGTLPTTVIIDKNGLIVFKKEGVANYNTLTFKHQLKQVINANTN